MNKDLIELLNSKKLVVSEYLIKSSIKNKLSLNEFLVLIYIDNDLTKTFDIESMSNVIGIDSNSTMEALNSLMIKGLAKIESIKDGNLRMITEKVNIDSIYEQIIDDFESSTENQIEDDIYKKFEGEIGRPLSSMELEIISGWIKSGVKEEIIIGALKEAVYNGTTSFRYIDKIIYEWDKKGFKTMADVKKHQDARREQKNKDKEISKKEQEILEYDWLGSNDN